MTSDSNARTGGDMAEEQSIMEGRAPRLPPILTAGALDLDGSASDNDPARTPTSELSSIPSLVHTPAMSWTSEDLNMLPQGLPSQDPQNGHPSIKQRADYFSPISQNTPGIESSRATHKASTQPALDKDLICIRRHSNSASQSPEPRLPSLTRGLSTQTVIGPTSSSQPARLRTHMRRRRDGPEYSVYLNQTFATAEPQYYRPPRQPQPLRTQGMAYSATNPRSRAYPALPSGAKTVGNTPTQSPGLFTPTTRHNGQGDESEESPYNTPMLHPTHLQKPKETHKLLKDYDPISGRKVVNNYEFLEKLGSGQHGTVKLGRQVGCTTLVAIKIVRRFSKKLRLGKSGDPNDMIKKEVAILKKARHEHVVSLLEVIDDDEFGKVYLVLEFVERGEIVWRKKTDKDIAVFEMERVKREKLQRVDDAYEEEERRKFNASVGSRRKEKFRLLEQRKLQALEILKLRAEERRRNNLAESPFWSLEYSTDLEEELVVGTCHEATAAPLEPSTIVDSEKPRSPSSAHPRQGKISDQRSHDIAFQSTLDQIIATESAWTTEEEEFMQVPCLTVSQALDAFRDTVLGLEYLHYQGIIHRDIKPANLLWTSDRRVKISDFGVSYLGKPIREDDNNEERAEADADDLDEAIELAKTVGTPAFYAPELCDPELFDVSKNPNRPLITGQIDVWALGVTLYAMIFGRLPFFDVNEFAMYEKIARQEVFIPRIRLKGVENVEADSAMDERTKRLLTELRSAENTNPEEIRMLEALRQENSSGDSMAMNKRFDDILEYEEVDDDLRDLLKRLLDKQPLKRINLKEVKRHSWVLRGIVDKSAWIDKTDPSVQSQGRKIEVSTEEVQEAVVEVSASISLVDRTFDHIKSTFRRLGSVVRGRPDGRKRRNSNSNAVEKTVYTSASKGSGNTPNGRRSSLRVDERYPVPHATKEGSEHPLSQSIVATPELKSGRTSYDENRDLLSCAHEPTYRPTFLWRSPSNAESTKTIKSVAQSTIPGGSPSLGEMTFPPMTPLADSNSSSSLGAFGRRFLNNMSINRRERSGESASQSSRSPSVENRSQITSSSIESLHLFQSTSDRRPGSQFPRASSHRRRTICSTADLSCPNSEPSFRERQALFSHSDDVHPIAVSSSSDQIASSMSESTSHPSIASVVSGASSLSMVTDEYQSLLKDMSNPSTIVSKSPRSVLAPDDIVDHLCALKNKTEGDNGSIDEDEAGYNGEGELDSDSDEGIEIGRRRSKHFDRNHDHDNDQMEKLQVMMTEPILGKERLCIH